MTKKKIYISRAIEYDYDVPFDEDYYPGMTMEEAKAAEEKRDWKYVKDNDLDSDDPPTITSYVEIIDDGDDERPINVKEMEDNSNIRVAFCGNKEAHNEHDFGEHLEEHCPGHG